jgi:hypothetical protein
MIKTSRTGDALWVVGVRKALKTSRTGDALWVVGVRKAQPCFH